MKKLIPLVILLLVSMEVLLAQGNRPIFEEMPGMVSYTYRDSFSKDVAATLDTLQAMGIKDMEFSNLFGKTAAELRQLLDERDMFCSSFGVGYPDLVNKTQEVAANAKTLGANFVRVAWIPHEAPFDLSDAENAIADFNKAGKILKEEHDLTFCYHNHGYEFYSHDNGTFFDYMMDHTDPEYVSYEIDILWTFFPGGDPAALINKYPDRFKLMHLKDLKKGVEGNMSGGTPKENDVVLGTGQLDLPAILKAAKEAGIAHFYIEDESPVYYQQVPKSIKYLQGLRY